MKRGLSFKKWVPSISSAAFANYCAYLISPQMRKETAVKVIDLVKMNQRQRRWFDDVLSCIPKTINGNDKHIVQ